jgi:hypothetical protein
MRERCHIKPHPRYGGRGIVVCERWRESFENFIADMGFRPSPKHSLERRDNDGPYSPENCKWATPIEQANNKTNTRRVTLNGVTKSLSEWCRALGINRHSAFSRIYSRGWAPERALTVPFKRHAVGTVTSR